MIDVCIWLIVGATFSITCLALQKLEDLKTINREILKQLKKKEKDDGIRTTN